MLAKVEEKGGGVDDWRQRNYVRQNKAVSKVEWFVAQVYEIWKRDKTAQGSYCFSLR